MRAVLDAGALIAIDRRDRRMLVWLDALQANGADLTTSTGVIAQVWRDGRRQAALARLLGGVDSVSLDESDARKVGELLASSGSSDPIDAHLSLLVEHGDDVLTSDVGDLSSLLEARGVDARIRVV